MENFVDIFENIVINVRQKYDDDGNEPYYMHGHPLEIFNTLSEKSKSETYKYSKYPLIALFQDFEESNDKANRIVENITIAIMMETDPNFIAPTRYGSTFKPVLQPIYELLKTEIEYNRFVTSDNMYNHKKVDRLYWGKEDTFGNSAGIGNDKLDAIVISGLTLGINECNTLPTYRITETGELRITEGNHIRIT